MSELKSLCVFCGSKSGADPGYARAAVAFGKLLAARRVRLIYGGGGIGLMGRVAETVLAHGGEVTGVIPDFLLQREVGDPGVTELVVVDSMHERKRRMFELADAFAVLPGGLGTLDEAIEIITWRMLGLHRKPIAVLNMDDCWKSFEALITSVIAQGFADESIREHFTLVDSAEALLAVLDRAPPVEPPASTRRL